MDLKIINIFVTLHQHEPTRTTWTQKGSTKPQKGSSIWGYPVHPVLELILKLHCTMGAIQELIVYVFGPAQYVGHFKNKRAGT